MGKSLLGIEREGTGMSAGSAIYKQPELAGTANVGTLRAHFWDNRYGVDLYWCLGNLYDYETLKEKALNLGLELRIINSH